jgi:hypothetical protein
MARTLGLVLMLVVVVACGGGGAPAAAGSGAAGGGGGSDLPGPSNVLFGTSFDPASFGVAEKSKQFKQGTPLVAVGRSLAAQAASGVMVQVGSSGSTTLPKRPVTASNNPDNADLFAVDLTADKLPPGTWIVSFIGGSGRIIASGNVTITP